MERQNRRVGGDHHRALDEPARPLRSGEDHEETFGMLEVRDQERSRRGQEESAQNRSGPDPERARRGKDAEEYEQERNEVRTRGDSLRPCVEADLPVPGRAVRDVVSEDRGGGAVLESGVAGADLVGKSSLLAPEKDPALGSARRERIERRLV